MQPGALSASPVIALFIHSDATQIEFIHIYYLRASRSNHYNAAQLSKAKGFALLSFHMHVLCADARVSTVIKSLRAASVSAGSCYARKQSRRAERERSPEATLVKTSQNNHTHTTLKW